MITHIFCHIDDFCQIFEKKWNKILLRSKQQSRVRSSSLSMSEMMTIIICFHNSHYQNFKAFYNTMILGHYHSYFPKAMSYSRFIQKLPSVTIPLFCYFQFIKGKKENSYCIDSTYLPVCHNKRIHSHKVFKKFAQRGKTTLGWFFGFKLHLVVNMKGELINFSVTEGNIDDRKVVDSLTQGLTGKLFGDKGYLSSDLFKTLYARGLKLVTKLRANMKNKLMDTKDKLLLKSRGFIESIIGQLKNKYIIHHTRYRSCWSMMINVMSGLIAYSLSSKKPQPRVNKKKPILIEP